MRAWTVVVAASLCAFSQAVWTQPVTVGTAGFDHFSVEERRLAILAANDAKGTATLSGTTNIFTANGTVEKGFVIYAPFARGGKKNAGYLFDRYE